MVPLAVGSWGFYYSSQWVLHLPLASYHQRYGTGLVTSSVLMYSFPHGLDASTFMLPQVFLPITITRVAKSRHFISWLGGNLLGALHSLDTKCLLSFPWP